MNAITAQERLKCSKAKVFAASDGLAAAAADVISFLDSNGNRIEELVTEREAFRIGVQHLWRHLYSSYDALAACTEELD